MVMFFKSHSRVEPRVESEKQHPHAEHRPLCFPPHGCSDGCILAGPSPPSALEAGDPPPAGGRKLEPNILTRGTWEQLRQILPGAEASANRAPA